MIIGAATLLCLWPLRRPRRLGLFSWALTMVPNELPFLAFLIWVLLPTVLFLDGGAPTSALGWASLGGAALVTLGLGRLPVLPEDSSILGRLPWARILLLPFLTGRGDVERIADLSYGDAGRRNRLDVYRHRSRPTGCPVLIYLHGGGYFSGRKNKEARPLLYRMAAEGWLCVSANYRLRPAATYPDHLVDVKKVIAWPCWRR